MSFTTIIEFIIIVFPAYFLAYKFSVFFLGLEAEKKEETEKNFIDQRKREQIDLILEMAELAIKTELLEFRIANRIQIVNRFEGQPDPQNVRLSGMETCIRLKYASMVSSLIQNNQHFDLVLPLTVSSSQR